MSIEATFQDNSLTAEFQGTGPAQTGEDIAGLLDSYLGNSDWRTSGTGLRQLGSWTKTASDPPGNNEYNITGSTLKIDYTDSDGTDWTSFFSGLSSGVWFIFYSDEDNQVRLKLSSLSAGSDLLTATIDQTESKGTISNGAEVSVSVDVAGGEVDSVFGRTGAVTAQSGDYNEGQISNKKEYIVIAASDETSNLSSGADKATFRMPFAATVTEVRADVNTAPTGSTLIVDINESGTSIFSTKITIDAGETTSETAATAPVISDSSIAENAEISIDIDQVGSSTAGAGLRITLIVER